MMKRVLLVLLNICIGMFIQAQDTTLYNKYNEKVSSKDSATYYKLVYRNAADTNVAKVLLYYMSGELKAEYNYSVYSKRLRQGLELLCSETGMPSREANYIADSLEGKFITYWSNGLLKRQDNYRKGVWIDGKCYSSTGVDTSYFNYSNPPEFNGGRQALVQYISRSVKYPANAKRMGIEGSVLVRFTIDKDGKVIDTKVIKSISKELDEEALRVINAMPNWVPGQLDGEGIKFSFALPIAFRLN
jgi:periplasmic protein TonB